MRLCFVRAIILVIHHLALGQSAEVLKTSIVNELSSINSGRHVIQIAVRDNTESNPRNLATAVSSTEDQDHSLQRRDVVEALVGVKGLAGIAYLVFQNLGTIESAVKVLWFLGLKKCFKKGTKLRNGGCLSPDGESILWKGEIVEFRHEMVHVFVLSPKDCRQTILIKGQTVFLNKNQIVEDRSTGLLAKPLYRKCEDGSQWYTNLPVGEDMTDDEIKKFRELQVQVEHEKKQLVKSVLVAVRNGAKKTVSNVKHSLTGSRNGSGRFSPSEERSRSNSPSSLDNGGRLSHSSRSSRISSPVSEQPWHLRNPQDHANGGSFFHSSRSSRSPPSSDPEHPCRLDSPLDLGGGYDSDSDWDVYEPTLFELPVSDVTTGTACQIERSPSPPLIREPVRTFPEATAQRPNSPSSRSSILNNLLSKVKLQRHVKFKSVPRSSPPKNSREGSESSPGKHTGKPNIRSVSFNLKRSKSNLRPNSRNGKRGSPE